MIGFSFIYTLILYFFLYFHLEFIFFFFYKKFWLISIEKKERLILKSNLSYVYNVCSSQLGLTYILFFFSLKTAPLLNTHYYLFLNLYLLNIILIIFFLYINKVIFFFNKNFNKYLTLIFTTILFFTFLLIFCDSLLIFIFILELLSVIYYFFFLTTHLNSKAISITQYKNFILFYLWNSFFTTLLYGLSCIFLIWSSGTLNFYELNLFTPNLYTLLVLIISIFIKLGLPGFHFFKIELYKYLDNISIFFFSILTIYINFIVLIFLFLQPFILNFFILYKFFFFIIFFFLYIVIFIYNIKTLYEFLAVSSIITIITFSLILFI